MKTYLVPCIVSGIAITPILLIVELTEVQADDYLNNRYVCNDHQNKLRTSVEAIVQKMLTGVPLVSPIPVLIDLCMRIDLLVSSQMLNDTVKTQLEQIKNSFPSDVQSRFCVALF